MFGMKLRRLLCLMLGHKEFQVIDGFVPGSVQAISTGFAAKVGSAHWHCRRCHAERSV